MLTDAVRIVTLPWYHYYMVHHRNHLVVLSSSIEYCQEYLALLFHNDILLYLNLKNFKEKKKKGKDKSWRMNGENLHVKSFTPLPFHIGDPLAMICVRKFKHSYSSWRGQASMEAVRIPSQTPGRLLGAYSHNAEPIAVMPMMPERGRA